DARPYFTCGDNDLDEFYSRDSILSANQLLSVSYGVLDETESLVAYFSVSNDAISRDHMPNSRFHRLFNTIPLEKRYSTLPAVKIGRLGVSERAQCNKLGTNILDFLKVWFTHKNKTGCRFIVVDAYNNPRTINFYEKNGFKFLVDGNKNDSTRIMYFDLIPFINFVIESQSIKK